MSRRPHEPDEPARLPSKKPDAIGMRPPSLTDVHDESATGVDKKTATRELAEVKARTMYRMVFDTGKQKVLYMSNLQAALVADDDASLGKMLSDGFEIPEPRCVINLLPGALEIGLKELRSAALSHIDRFMADVLLPLAQQNNAVILVSAFPNMCSLSPLRSHGWPRCARLGGMAGRGPSPSSRAESTFRTATRTPVLRAQSGGMSQTRSPRGGTGCSIC